MIEEISKREARGISLGINNSSGRCSFIVVGERYYSLRGTIDASIHIHSFVVSLNEEPS